MIVVELSIQGWELILKHILSRPSALHHLNRKYASPSCIRIAKMAASRSDATSLSTFDGVENLVNMTDIQKAYDELSREEVFYWRTLYF